MQQISGQLRSVTANTGFSGNLGNTNVGDSAPGFNLATQTSSWSTGAYIVDAIANQPQIAAPWEVYAWNLSFQGFTAQPTNPATSAPSAGRLGQIWGGLLVGGSVSNGPAGVPWVTPLGILPVPNIGITLIWDGAVDPPFPYVGTTNAAQGFQYSLPQPLQLESGQQLYFGLWITPTIGENIGLWITNTSYGILYDLTQPQPITTP